MHVAVARAAADRDHRARCCSWRPRSRTAPLQAALWIVALALDYGGPLVRGVAGYRVHPAHFAERFSLIVIIALGESIVGDRRRRGRRAARRGDRPSPRCCADRVRGALVGVLRRRRAARRSAGWRELHRRRAQHAGARRVRLPAPADDRRHRAVRARRRAGRRPRRRAAGAGGRRPRCSAASRCTCSRTSRSSCATPARSAASAWSPRRSAAARCVPLGTEVDALAALALVAAIAAGLIAYEAIRFRESRARVRLAA